VHYVGVAWSTGEQFDASWTATAASASALAGRVIQGWDQGVAGMRWRPAPADDPPGLAYVSAARRRHRPGDPHLRVDLLSVS